MFAALALLLSVAAAPPPAPSRWVTDQTGQLRADDLAALDRELEAFEQQTGHQLVVWVGRTTGGEPIEDWAVRTFEAWKVGRAKLDDGVALFVMIDDRAARIEVGYGLEERLTDARSSRILRDVLAPRMKAGDISGAVSATTRAIVSELGPGSAPPVEPGRELFDKVKVYAAIIAAALFLLLLIINPRAAFFLLMFLNIGRKRSGGGSGGFGGGGGRSGGGGATGRW